MTETDQQELDFRAPIEGGYESWQWDRAEAVRRIAEVWGLPLNCSVLVKLVNIDGEFAGKLLLHEIPQSLNRRLPLTLKIGRLVFSSGEIETCVKLNA